MPAITPEDLYILAKVLGYVIGTAATVLIGAGVRLVYKVSTNHLPHIQKSLDDVQKEVGVVKGEVSTLNTRVEGVHISVGLLSNSVDETRTSVRDLNTAFISHLDKPKRRNR